VSATAERRPLSLTFDDGPHVLWTPAVLRALDDVQAAATFFVMAGAARRAVGAVEAIVAAGHSVQLHCHRHVRHTELSEDEIDRDAGLALEVLAAAGVQPTIWRPPWGVSTCATRAVAARLGLELIGWDIDTHDWRGDSAESMLTRVGPRLRGGGSVLMHDGLGPGARRAGCANTVALIAPLVHAASEHGIAIAPLAIGVAL
jgi:peptidoglycan/xylan/chitin deacetylase (PgdA/CDA1 family)